MKGVRRHALTLALGLLQTAGAGMAAEGAALPAISATRCPANPLITPASSPTLGRNINGPSVIRAPPWLARPLGRYYMYFADHRGAYIRLAYADELCGAWQVYAPGTLRLDQAKDFVGHIASPDVHVDHAHREIRMYFHGPRAGRAHVQDTGLAVSSDGIHFRLVAARLGPPYFRVFEWRSAWFAVAMRGKTAGALLRSAAPDIAYTRGPDIIPRMRHAAVLPWRGALLVFYSRVGDAPERILVSSMTMGTPWREPVLSPPAEVLRPETDYEGAALPVRASRNGPTGPARQLRDPAIFQDGGKTYLFYAVAGEAGIGLAELQLGQ